MLKDTEDMELYEEIGEECRKFGEVVKVGTDGEGATKATDYVAVYVLYETIEG